MINNLFVKFFLFFYLYKCFFFRKKIVPDESLIDFTSKQFNNNSLFVNYSKNMSKEFIDYSIFGTKKLVVPLSKILDYGIVSLVSIVIFNYINYINYY
jgi:hypothetical protein